MLLRILPEQVVKDWDIISKVIEKSRPPYVDSLYNELISALYSILIEESIIWGYYDSDNELRGLIMTTTHTDIVTKSNNLLIYALWVIRPMGLQAWRESAVILKRYAKGMGYKSILAYVQVPEVVKLVKALGGDVSWTLAEFKLEDTDDNDA